MNATIHYRPRSVPRILTQIAKASAGVMFGAWAVLVIAEMISNHFELPALYAVYQALALAVVFFGYFYSLRHPLRGSWFTAGGVALFYVIVKATTGLWPPAAAVWLAFPAVLILGAVGYLHHFRHRQQTGKQ